MEWVETTARTVDEARDAALDQLGVAADEAEFEIVEEPRPGLFGRMRGEARIRARVKPTQARPKQDRRRRSRSDKTDRRKKSDSDGSSGGSAASAPEQTQEQLTDQPAAAASTPKSSASKSDKNVGRTRSSNKKSNRPRSESTAQEATMSNDDRPESNVTPDEVGAAAVEFMEGLVSAFGSSATVDLQVDDIELDVNVRGEELGLLVGPGGRTLNAVQDLARVAAQRRLGDHDTRLRIDVAGYRERRSAALGDFARKVADSVRSSGESRSMEPMASADRKVVHDVLNEEDGVTTRSVGEDPNRRIVVEPA